MNQNKDIESYYGTHINIIYLNFTYNEQWDKYIKNNQNDMENVEKMERRIKSEYKSITYHTKQKTSNLKK